MTTQEKDGSKRFRNWRAFHNQMPPLPKPIRVSGEYFLDRRSGGCELRLANPQGINDRVLLIDLVVVEGPGGDWVEVEGRFDAEPGAYSSVQVVDAEGESIGLDIEVAS